MNLSPGWNLVGNSSAVGMDVATSFGDASQITTVWKWNRSTDRWAFYAPSMQPSTLTAYAQNKGYDILTRIEPKEGFWVNVPGPVVVAGPAAAGVTLSEADLIPGWNLMSSADNLTASQLTTGLSSNMTVALKSITTTWAWDATLARWRFYAPALDAQGGTVLPDYITQKGYLPIANPLTPADGYWLNVGMLPLPGSNIADYATRDISSKLTVAGEWNPFTSLSGTALSQAALIDFYGVAKLGTSQQEGVIFTGWAYTGFSNTATDITPVNVAVLAQNPNGTLSIATDQVLPSSLTNGAGSVIVADFNGDGKDDIFLAAHNESPFMLKASTVYLSKPDGSYDKVVLNDAVMAHDAILGRFNGKPAVIITSFGMQTVSPFSSAYTYNGAGGFDFVPIAGSVFQIPSMSVAQGDFLGLGHDQYVYGDLTWGPGFSWLPTTPFQAVIYDYNGSNLVDTPVFLPAPYFNGKPQYDAFVSNWDPVSKSHQSRIWTDDINQDGKPDIVIGTEIWPGWKSQLQLLVNQGDGTFVDQTTSWNSPWNEDGAYDYSLRMVDLDGSGITTYLAAQNTAYCPQTNCRNNVNHGDYILVNDGTGQFHLAMHDEFVNLGNQVNQYLFNQLQGTNYYVGQTGDTPRFVGYQAAGGGINFVAKVSASKLVAGVWLPTTMFVNLPLQINLKTDFRKNITILDRHGSKNIRTFAGDDTIYGGNQGGTCNIDGGLGTNAIVYAGSRANYTITKTANGFVITDTVGADGTDIVKNIQLLKFADTQLDLRTIQ